jgi:hypothetical protein
MPLADRAFGLRGGQNDNHCSLAAPSWHTLPQCGQRHDEGAKAVPCFVNACSTSCDRGQRGQDCAAPAEHDLDAGASPGRRMARGAILKVLRPAAGVVIDAHNLQHVVVYSIGDNDGRFRDDEFAGAGHATRVCEVRVL